MGIGGLMAEEVDVVIVGAGQAGLAVSRELTQAGVAHAVLEKGRVGQTWRRWWDSCCLISPNWSVRLPGHPYDGEDPDGFWTRDEVVVCLERYASAFGAPVRDGVEVMSLRRGSGGGFVLETSSGPIAARTVVVASGAYQRPQRPAGAASLPPDLLQVDLDGYRSPAALPPGGVLVVGSGQSGCQIAEELCEAGRDVFLACGRAPWVPRRIGDRDAIWWGIETGFFEAPLSSLPSPAARLAANVQLTGSGGGHDLHYRTLQQMGVTLLGRFLGVDGGRVRFAPDLGESVAWGDERYAQLMQLVRNVAAQRGLTQPEAPEPPAFNGDAPVDVSLSGLGAVVFAGGFRPAYASWVHVAGAFDEMGFPLQRDGASLLVAGLYFVGVHFLRKRQSSLLFGVGEDAAIVARHISEQQTAPSAKQRSPRLAGAGTWSEHRRHR
jgi:putative flavoprotein involved in K+ transport